MPEKKERINPQITRLNIGTRNLRTIKIYPASFGDQLEMTDLITETVQEFFKSRESVEQKTDIALVKFLVDLIRDNLIKIIKLISDENEEMLKEITNVQAIELATLVYEMNYGESVKNVQSLFKKIQPLFPSKRPLQQSVKDIPTD
jgi:transcription termination factor NusB